MTISEWGTCVFAVVVLLILVRSMWRMRVVIEEHAWRPKELQDTEVVYAERVFRASRPISIIAKLDRGYRYRNGLITLVELKTRRVDRVYLSDVIELSAQRVALQAQTREPVAPHGYVLVQQPERRQKTAYRVQLLTHAQVAELVARREAILVGETEARYTQWPALCVHCGFRQQCKPPSPTPKTKTHMQNSARG